MLFPILEPSSLLVVVDQPDERHANRIASVLEWYDRHRAYTSDSDEVVTCSAILNLRHRIKKII